MEVLDIFFDLAIASKCFPTKCTIVPEMVLCHPPLEISCCSHQPGMDQVESMFHRCCLAWLNFRRYRATKEVFPGRKETAHHSDPQVLFFFYKTELGGGFKYFYFHPYLGKIPMLTNHQPVKGVPKILSVKQPA